MSEENKENILTTPKINSTNKRFNCLLSSNLSTLVSAKQLIDIQQRQVGGLLHAPHVLQDLSFLSNNSTTNSLGILNISSIDDQLENPRESLGIIQTSMLEETPFKCLEDSPMIKFDNIEDISDLIKFSSPQMPYNISGCKNDLLIEKTENLNIFDNDVGVYFPQSIPESNAINTSPQRNNLPNNNLTFGQGIDNNTRTNQRSDTFCFSPITSNKTYVASANTLSTTFPINRTSLSTENKVDSNNLTYKLNATITHTPSKTVNVDISNENKSNSVIVENINLNTSEMMRSFAEIPLEINNCDEKESYLDNTPQPEWPSFMEEEALTEPCNTKALFKTLDKMFPKTLGNNLDAVTSCTNTQNELQTLPTTSGSPSSDSGNESNQCSHSNCCLDNVDCRKMSKIKEVVSDINNIVKKTNTQGKILGHIFELSKLLGCDGDAVRPVGDISKSTQKMHTTPVSRASNIRRKSDVASSSTKKITFGPTDVMNTNCLLSNVDLSRSNSLTSLSSPKRASKFSSVSQSNLRNQVTKTNLNMRTSTSKTNVTRGPVKATVPVGKIVRADALRTNTLSNKSINKIVPPLMSSFRRSHSIDNPSKKGFEMPLAQSTPGNPPAKKSITKLPRFSQESTKSKSLPELPNSLVRNRISTNQQKIRK